MAVLAADPGRRTPTTEPASLEIVGGPYLQAPRPTASHRVDHQPQVVSKVEYGRSAEQLTNVGGLRRQGRRCRHDTPQGHPRRPRAGTTPWHYRVVSTGIAEFRPYKVTFGETVSRQGQFTTLDPRKERFSFCVLNDRHDRAAELRQALKLIDWGGVDLVVGLGDMMNDPMTQEQIFRNFINPCAELFADRIPLIMVRGNHETRGTLARSLMNYFPSPAGDTTTPSTTAACTLLVLDAAGQGRRQRGVQRWPRSSRTFRRKPAGSSKS